MFEGVVDWLKNLLGPFRYPPLSTISVLIISIAVGLITIAVNYLLLDVEKLKNYAAEISEWKREMRQALASGDRKKLVKLRKREPYIRKIETELMAERFKPSLIYMIPLWIFFIIFAGVFSTEVGYVAKLPFSLPFVGDRASFVTSVSYTHLTLPTILLV